MTNHHAAEMLKAVARWQEGHPGAGLARETGFLAALTEVKVDLGLDPWEHASGIALCLVAVGIRKASPSLIGGIASAAESVGRWLQELESGFVPNGIPMPSGSLSERADEFVVAALLGRDGVLDRGILKSEYWRRAVREVLADLVEATIAARLKWLESLDDRYFVGFAASLPDRRMMINRIVENFIHGECDHWIGLGQLSIDRDKVEASIRGHASAGGLSNGESAFKSCLLQHGLAAWDPFGDRSAGFQPGGIRPTEESVFSLWGYLIRAVSGEPGCRRRMDEINAAERRHELVRRQREGGLIEALSWQNANTLENTYRHWGLHLSDFKRSMLFREINRGRQRLLHRTIVLWKCRHGVDCRADDGHGSAVHQALPCRQAGQAALACGIPSPVMPGADWDGYVVVSNSDYLIPAPGMAGPLQFAEVPIKGCSKNPMHCFKAGLYQCPVPGCGGAPRQRRMTVAVDETWKPYF